jgi:hypothetical protein
MKNLMRAVLVGIGLLGSTATFAAAQAVVNVQWNQDRDDRQAYREGFRQGQWDAQHGRRADGDDNRWREWDDRRAYREGYTRGYQEVAGNGYYRGGNFNYGADSARRYGYEDGLNDGRHDRYSGHSFRPTHDDNYRHADRGYNRGFGNRDYYKQAYREAYEQGYRQGYGSGGGWRR